MMRGLFWIAYVFLAVGLLGSAFAAAVFPYRLTFSYSEGVTFNTRSGNCAAVIQGLIESLNARARSVQWAAAPSACTGGFVRPGQVQPMVVRSYSLADGTSNKEHSFNVTLLEWDRGGGVKR